MNARPSLAKRMVAVASTVALSIGALVSGSAAHAANGDLGNIDLSRNGSITLHKHESGSQTSTGIVDGSNKTTAGGIGVPDVVFTAYKITNLNLTKSADWQRLQNLQVAENACGVNNTAPSISGFNFDRGTAFPATSSTGETTMRNLAVGAYLICETSAPESVKKKAAPFIVTLPQPGTSAGTWVYDVHAFPKNTVIAAPTKTTTVEAFGIGATNDERQVSFKIRARIPYVAKTTRQNNQPNEYFKYFILGDSLTDGYTNPQIVSVNLANDTSADGTPISAGFYTKAGESASSSWVSVSFNEGTRTANKGLTFLRDNPGKYVVVTIKAHVTKVTTDGKLPNIGYLLVDTVKQPSQPPYDPNTPPFNPPTGPGNPPTPKGNNPPPTATNKSVSVWGRVQFTKVAADARKTPLKGAEFEVFEGTEQGSACTATTKGNAIKVNGKTRFPSSDQGVVSIDGLFVAQGEGVGIVDPQIATTYKCYVLKEVVAPVGYLLPTGGREFTPVKVTAGNTATGSVSEISNTQVSVPDLPLTGASGTVLMTAIGSSMIFAAAGVAMVRRRQKMQVI